MPLPNGSTFAGFRIVGALGPGGMGEVYLVEHPRLLRHVCLKILPADALRDPEFRDRFAREAELASSLDHPNVIRFHDRGDYRGHPWVTVDFVDGPDVASLLRKQKYASGVPPRTAFRIVSAVAEALDYAHDRGLLHRGVQPAAIAIAETEGSGHRILLGDFGIAPRAAAYAAPEQRTGKRVDGRADQYGLAATAYHLLTGSPPVPGADADLAEVKPELAAHAGALTRALSTSPAARFATCADFALALSEPGGGSAERTMKLEAPVLQPEAPVAKPDRPVDKREQRKLVLVASMALAVVAIVAMVLAGVHFLGGRGDEAATAAPPAAEYSQTAGGQAVPLPAAPPACGDDGQLLASMSLRDKLAQQLAVGVTGEADARAVASDYHVGNIMVGSWTDLSMLGAPLQDIVATSGAPLPLGVSVDEEGGRVSRLSTLIGEQPAPRILAQTMTPEQVYDIARQRGDAMRRLGITVDFAPVADVSDQDADTVIGDRSFSDDPAVVTAYAGAYARGLRDAGVTPVLKHFPGHGHASGDSHHGGVVTPPLADLETNDLVPYKTLVAEPGVAVMVGHMQVPGLTGDDPASLSPPAYGLLRSGSYGAPGFGGLIFTDDLSSMGAINQLYSVPEAVLKSLQAGADVALWITTDQVPAVLDRLEAAVNAGELPLANVDQAVLRVAALKGRSPQCGG